MKNKWIALGIIMAGMSLASSGHAKEKPPEAPTSELTFVVLKGYNGQPLRNAAVVLHPVNGRDQQEKGGLELKTNADGKASYDGIPYGKLRVQVLAHGFQTYGEDFVINQPAHEFTIKMERPSGQYSIYEDHPGDSDKGKGGTTPETQPRPQ